MTVDELKEAWERFGDTPLMYPIDEDGAELSGKALKKWKKEYDEDMIDEDFEVCGIVFEKGADRFDIWHFFDENYYSLSGGKSWFKEVGYV